MEIGLADACAAALTALAAASALTAQEVTSTVEALAQLQSWLWVFGFLPLLTLLPLLYPDGLPRGRTWRAAAMASVAGMAALAAGLGLYPEALVGHVRIDKPVTWSVGATVLTTVGAVLLVPSVVVALAALVVRWRRSRGIRRRQVVLLVVAVAVLAVVTAAQGVVPAPVDTLAQAVAVALVPVAIGVAVTRHRLYELDLAICRTLVGVSLAACLAGLYLTLFALLRAATPEGSALATAAAAGVTGVLVQPLARRLSTGVERLYFGDRADPYAVSARLAARLAERDLDVADVPQAVCDTVVDALRLGGARIELDDEPAHDHTVAASGADPREQTGRSRAFPLRHRGEVVARMTVSPRRGEPRLDERDTEILTTVADQAAPAVSALRLHRQLQLSRESLVLAREGERRTLRRDLHDGLGATLAGVRLQLESAAATSDQPAVTALLGAASAGVAHAVAEVRTVTNRLRPPAVDDIGLAAALALLAERFRTPDLRVHADVGDLSGLPAAVEVATYRIASEALANAARHAGATELWLEATTQSGPEGRRVAVCVVDDGIGLLPRERSTGLGLPSMRQRAEELGGTLELSSPATLPPTSPGGEHDADARGTRVLAVLPLPTTPTVAVPTPTAPTPREPS